LRGRRWGVEAREEGRRVLALLRGNRREKLRGLHMHMSARQASRRRVVVRQRWQRGGVLRGCS
jgi:diaminopimelate decarboxylase